MNGCPTPEWPPHVGTAHDQLDGERNPDPARCQSIMQNGRGFAQCDYPAGHEQHAGADILWLDPRLGALRHALQLAIDFHSADTPSFVQRYGAGMTTRGLCDRLRAALEACE